MSCLKERAFETLKPLTIVHHISSPRMLYSSSYSRYDPIVSILHGIN